MIGPSRWRRIGAAALALWFGLFMAESLALRSCPMHGGGEQTVAHAAHGVAHGARPDAPSVHDAPSPSTGDTGSPSTTPASCKCLGQCLGGGAVAVTPPAAVVVAIVVRAHDVAVSPRVWVPRSSAPHRLPFAIPPPGGRQEA